MSRPRYIVLGQDPMGSPVRVNVVRLLRSGLLIEGNSGSGKSWLMRRLAEEIARVGAAPQWIFDPEDEYATLREKFDFLLVGPGGDVPADVRTAALLARRLMEIKISAIFNLSELDEEEKQEWARIFFMAVIDSPRKLWDYTLVYLDEAHLFAPEKGEGSSVATRAVRAMATRGRKRGKRLVCATQRPAIFDKTVAAQMPNKAVGMISIDIDQDRAARSMGIRQKDKADFWDQIQGFEAGTFLVRGPAIGNDRIKVVVGPVVTTHLDPGDRRRKRRPPPTPAKIRKMLSELTDLPKEADEEANTVEGFKKKIRELEAKLREVPKPAVIREAKATMIMVPTIKRGDLGRLGRMAKKLAKTETAFTKTLVGSLREMRSISDQLAQRQQVVVSSVGSLETAVKAASEPIKVPGLDEPTKIQTNSVYGKLGTHPLDLLLGPNEMNLIKRGEIILAIKAYRARTGAELLAAKNLVMAARKRLPCDDCGHVHSGVEHGPERQAFVGGKEEWIKKDGNGVQHYDIASAYPESMEHSPAMKRPPGDTKHEMLVLELGWRLLGAFASVYPRGMTARAACTLVGVSRRSSSVDLQLARLRRQALIETQSGETRATSAGAKVAAERGLVDLTKKPPQALLDAWLGKLGKTARDILLCVVAAGERGIDRATIIERTGKSNKSSGVDLAFAQLKGVGLISKNELFFVAAKEIRP